MAPQIAGNARTSARTQVVVKFDSIGKIMYEIQLALGDIEEEVPGKGLESGESKAKKFRVSQYFDAWFDFNFPFRPLLAFIGESIEQNGPSVELALPEYYEHEDFITGSIILADEHVTVYFEHSLAYISFSSDDRPSLKLLSDTTKGRKFQHNGYGLEEH